MTAAQPGGTPTIRTTRFTPALFGVILGSLLLASGVHVGLVLLVNELRFSGYLQTLIIIVYWNLVSLLVTLLLVRFTKDTYEKPMKALAAAARKVASGDFSVYLPATHTADKLDYLDAMIIDFNKMVAELGSIETLKTDFFSNVSHEIKTPLAVIQNSAELLAREPLTPEQKERVAVIAQHARRLSSLISNILKLNKLEKQKLPPRAEPYDLCQQLAECALLFEDRWEEKGIDFEAEIEDQAMVEADRSLLELVWNNLLSNAIKFTERGGTVALRQTSSPEEVTVSVSDSGCGMDEHTLTHIFDKFYQGDTSHATEGNGLGLALALRVLRMTGGTIDVDSEPGRGSTFTVHLPRRSEKEAPQ